MLAGVQKRFSREINTDNYKLILTQKNGKIGLQKIDLNTGEETGFIVTSDRTPDYDIDSFSDLLFFKSGSKRVSCLEL